MYLLITCCLELDCFTPLWATEVAKLTCLRERVGEIADGAVGEADVPRVLARTAWGKKPPGSGGCTICGMTRNVRFAAEVDQSEA